MAQNKCKKQAPLGPVNSTSHLSRQQRCEIWNVDHNVVPTSTFAEWIQAGVMVSSTKTLLSTLLYVCPGLQWPFALVLSSVGFCETRDGWVKLRRGHVLTCCVKTHRRRKFTSGRHQWVKRSQRVSRHTSCLLDNAILTGQSSLLCWQASSLYFFLFCRMKKHGNFSWTKESCLRARRKTGSWTKNSTN